MTHSEISVLRELKSALMSGIEESKRLAAREGTNAATLLFAEGFQGGLDAACIAVQHLLDGKGASYDDR